jgi:DNA-directed RNA polymerase subunit RPC12/RpoP
MIKIYRCPECSSVWPKEDPPHQRKCPECGVRVQRKLIPAYPSEEYHPLRDNPFDLDGVIDKILKFSDAVSHSAFKAQEIAEKLSERNLADGEEYVDKVEFDAKLFNRRAQLVADMLTTQSLLHEAGLDSFIDEALLRIMDAKIAPRVQVVRQTVPEKRTAPK